MNNIFRTYNEQLVLVFGFWFFLVFKNIVLHIFMCFFSYKLILPIPVCRIFVHSLITISNQYVINSVINYNIKFLCCQVKIFYGVKKLWMKN